MGAGLATIVLLMLVVSWLYDRELDRSAVDGLARGSAFFLGLYLVVKILDFSLNGKWAFVFGPELSWESLALAKRSSRGRSPSSPTPTTARTFSGPFLLRGIPAAREEPRRQDDPVARHAVRTARDPVRIRQQLSLDR